jgi:WD40 repeat protein
MNEAAQDPEWRAGEVIDGRYEVIRLAGKGGMGRVYQVRHLQWGIDLAVKQPHPDALQSPRTRGQFVEEAEAWVSLGLHPNLCCCHYVRQFDGLPMVFAEYVPGGSLRSWITDGRLYEGLANEVLRRVLDVAIQFAWGLEHAHSRGMVHQDVKPDNVLLDTPGGDINAKVTDFGLARARAGTRLTPFGFGTRAGEAASILVSRAGLTPAYASPEQTVGAALSQRTDVYSYAVSVLEMFTGERLWRNGREAGQALNAFLAGGAAKPGTPVMPAALGALLGRCLRRDPAQRPGSMADIAAEISDIYQSATRSAYPRAMPRAADLRADELNNRALSLLDLGRTAEAEATFAAAQEADQRHLATTYNFGLLRWRRGDITGEDLLAQIDAVHEPTGDSVLVQCLRAYVHLERGDTERTQEILNGFGQDELDQPEVQAAQRALAAGSSGDLSIDYTIPIPPHDEDQPAGRMPVRFSRDGAYMVTGEKQGVIRLWDVQTGEALRTCTADTGSNSDSAQVEHVDVSADGKVGIGNVGSRVQVWDFTTGKLAHEFFVERLDIQDEGRDQGLMDVRLSPDGRWAFAARHGKLLTRVHEPLGAEIVGWDLQTGKRSPWQRIDGYGNNVSFEVSADSSHLIVVTLAESGPHRVSRFQLVYATQREHRVIVEMDAGPSAMAITADGRLAVTASEYERRIRVWDLRSGRCVQAIPTTGRIGSLAVSEDGRWAVSSGQEPERLWDLAAGKCLRTFDQQYRFATALWLSPDARTGRSAGGLRSSAMSWSFRIPSGYHAPPQLSRPRHVLELSRLSGETQVLIGDAERAIAERRYPFAHLALTRARAIPGHERDPKILRTWRELGRYLPRTGLRGAWTTALLGAEGSTGSLSSADIAADGSVAVTGHLNAVCLWDPKSGDLLRKYSTLVVEAVGLSANGQKVVSVGGTSSNSSVDVWSAQTGEKLFSQRIEGSKNPKVAVLSPDGKRLLWGNSDGLQLWEVDTGRHLRTLPGHPRPVHPRTKAWIGADNRTALSATKDSVRLWDLDNGECLLKVPVQEGPFSSLGAACVSPDGKHFVTAGLLLMRMWNSAGEPVQVFDCSQVSAAQFSPDGQFIVAATFKDIRVWDVGNGALVLTLGRAQNPIGDVDVDNIQFTADGRYVLVSGHKTGSTAQVWELDWELALLPNEE